MIGRIRIGHGDGAHAERLGRQRRLGGHGQFHEGALVACVHLEAVRCVRESLGGVSRHRVVVVAVPRAAEVAVLDRTLPERPTLEDYFLRVTEGKGADLGR